MNKEQKEIERLTLAMNKESYRVIHLLRYIKQLEEENAKLKNLPVKRAYGDATIQDEVTTTQDQ